MSRFLAVGAHPDDIELGCGGYLQHAEDRNVVLLTRGEAAEPCGFNREEEAQRAANVLSAKLLLYELVDTRVDLVGAIKALEDEIAIQKPDVLLIPARQDTHQDHCITYQAAVVASRTAACSVLSYVDPSSAHVFRPTWFVPLSAQEMSVKLEAIKCHWSQSHRHYMTEEYVVGMARYWGNGDKSAF